MESSRLAVYKAHIRSNPRSSLALLFLVIACATLTALLVWALVKNSGDSDNDDGGTATQSAAAAAPSAPERTAKWLAEHWFVMLGIIVVCLVITGFVWLWSERRVSVADLRTEAIHLIDSRATEVARARLHLYAANDLDQEPDHVSEKIYMLFMKDPGADYKGLLKNDGNDESKVAFGHRDLARKAVRNIRKQQIALENTMSQLPVREVNRLTRYGTEVMKRANVSQANARNPVDDVYMNPTLPTRRGGRRGK